MSRVRLLLVDDQPLLREGMRLLFEVDERFEVIGEAGTGAELLEQLESADQCLPDVVLMDIQMPEMDGVAATREVRRRFAHVQVIILTTFDDDEYVFEGLRAGACGYLLKDVSSSRLFEATLAAARGESFLQPSIAAKVVAEFSRMSSPTARQAAANAELEDPLTPREIELVNLLARGHSNRALAERVFLSEGTVKNHITKILAKLGASDRKQAVDAARQRGLIPPAR